MFTADYHIKESLYTRWVLNPLGLNKDNALVLWLLLFFAAIMGGTLYYFGGEIPIVLAIVYLTGIFLLSFLKIDYSFYLFILSVMLFEQYAIPGFEAITIYPGFFSNLKEISYLPFFDAGVVSPMELHLLFIIFSLMIHISLDKNYKLTPIPVLIPFLLFFFSLIGSFLYGIRGGGDFLIAMWEVRALFYLCIMYPLVPQIINTKEHIRVLVWVFIIGISFKAMQGVYRFIDLGFTTGGYDVLTNHEDAVFIVTLIVLFCSFLVFKVKDRQKIFLIIVGIVLLLGFYVAQRRAAYASLIVSLCTFIVLMPANKRASVLKFAIPIVAALFIYGLTFWNNDGTLGRPVQMIKSGIEEPDRYTNTRDYYSNLYREIENYNLSQTVVNNTVKGIGFGKRYEQPLPLAEIRFTLRDYIPHNQIIWVLVKMGAVGFFAFWFFFNSFVAKGTRIISVLEDPYLKAVAVVIVIAVINQMVVSFFDLQLTYYRNMLYLGCLMGMLPVIKSIDDKQQDSGVEIEWEEEDE